MEKYANNEIMKITIMFVIDKTMCHKNIYILLFINITLLIIK